jgi:AcrR family transcriptional regulator
MANLSTAELRKPIVIASAIREFARGCYHGTSIADVARASGISPAYVFKLFPSKEKLFVSALEDCFRQIIETFAAGADRSESQTPESIVDAMGEAYAELISDRDLIMLQVHAQSVADIGEITQAYRAGIAELTRFIKSRSGASDDAVQQTIAYGQLCHLIVTTGVADLTDDWAVILSHGIRHPR